jgi:hypothetical protein
MIYLHYDDATVLSLTPASFVSETVLKKVQGKKAPNGWKYEKTSPLLHTLPALFVGCALQINVETDQSATHHPDIFINHVLLYQKYS